MRLMSWPWLAVGALFVGACTFGSAPDRSCRLTDDCGPEAACRDGVCISFATPLDEPVDPGESSDAGDAAP